MGMMMSRKKRLPPGLYSNVHTWLRAMKRHICENKELIPSDDPGPLKYEEKKLGYLCTGCGKLFQIRFVDVKYELSKYKFISENINTPEGRTKIVQFEKEKGYYQFSPEDVGCQTIIVRAESYDQAIEKFKQWQSKIPGYRIWPDPVVEDRSNWALDPAIKVIS